MAKVFPADKSGGLFDYLKVKFKLANDGDLAPLFDTRVSVISEIRHGKREVNDKMLVRLCNTTGMTLKKVQALINHTAGAK